MSKRMLCLFDVDGTLTKSRQIISPEMKDILKELKKNVSVALVGGSDLSKISEQMDEDVGVINAYEYVFSENGLVAHKKGELIGQESILKYMGEEKLQTIINFCLQYMSTLKLPVKRGNFIEFRSGLINISPIGRSCSQKERDEFVEYDNVNKIREKFVKELQKHFPDMGLVFAIGGQISIDCFPVGWDKTYCLKYLLKDGFTSIHFFGDKTFEGGNDYELFIHKAVIGHTVKSPDDTMKQLKDLFNL